MTSPLAELRPETRQTDAELIVRAKARDERAFRELVNRYSVMVYSLVFRMTQNRELSEEMTQDVFIKVYQHLDRYDTARPFRPWILRIASNVALSELRKQARAKVTSLNELEEGGFMPEDNRPDLATVLERSDASRQVKGALDKLDPRYRQALLLRYQHELSYEEVADAMAIPLNTVRTWLRRGLEKLRNEVKEHAV